MKKIIFVLTYNEGLHWHDNYPCHRYDEFFKDYQLIFLDCGDQESIAHWCHATGSIHHRSENNLGTTGGYNWFMRVGAMLKQPRIAVMQADVQVFDTRPFDIMLADSWTKQDFCFWPNPTRDQWRPNGNAGGDVGQFFSLDPTYFLDNGWLCDENYTVTHFEAMDLWIRMSSNLNQNLIDTHNLLYEFYTDDSLTPEQQLEADRGVFKFHQYTNHTGLHNPWFLKNFDYFQKKWRYDFEQITPEEGFQLFRQHRLDWNPSPWLPGHHPRCAARLNVWRLETERNISVGQLPYPVEHEVNRFYTEWVKTGLITF